MGRSKKQRKQRLKSIREAQKQQRAIPGTKPAMSTIAPTPESVSAVGPASNPGPATAAGASSGPAAAPSRPRPNWTPFSESVHAPRPGPAAAPTPSPRPGGAYPYSARPKNLGFFRDALSTPLRQAQDMFLDMGEEFMPRADNMGRMANWIETTKAPQKAWGATKGVAKAGAGVAKGLFSGAYHTLKFMTRNTPMRVASGLLVGAAAFTAGAGSSALPDVARNTDPYSGTPAKALHSMGGAGLAGMALLANMDKTTDLAGEDYVRSVHRAQGRVDGPMSFSGSGGGSLRGFNGGATGDLALSLSNLRRGR